jgi:hypothetical protein
VADRVGIGRSIGQQNIVENHTNAIVLGVAIERYLSTTRHANAMQCDVAHDGRRIALDRAGGCMSCVKRDWIRRIAHTDIVIKNIMHQPAARSIRLDANPIVGAVQREIKDANLADTAVGFASNRHPVSPIKMVVADRHIGDAAGAAFDRNIIVAGANVAMGNRNVL